jgi:hypothetical protein
MVIDRVIITKQQIPAYKDQGYLIGHCDIPGKVLAIFWVPANA